LNYKFKVGQIVEKSELVVFWKEVSHSLRSCNK
jgi:hypothetical protein